MAADEKNDQKNDTGQNRKNNWGGFMIYFAIILGTIIGMAIFGANFVYFTRINLNMMFPTKVDEKPYGTMDWSSHTNNNKCGSAITGLLDVNDSYTAKLLFNHGFPYNIEKSTDDSSYWNKFCNWVVENITNSYLWQREFIQFMINFVGSSCKSVDDSRKDIVPFILGPLCVVTIIIVTSLWWIPTLVSVFYNNNKGLWVTLFSILGLLFGWTWILIALLTIVQILGVLFTFTVLPTMLNSKDILTIISEKYNSYYLFVLLLISLTVAAFINFNAWTTVPMLLVFIYGLWKARPWKPDLPTATAPAATVST
jgi:hypothetical protein